MKKKMILITGSKGFIGGRLIKLPNFISYEKYIDNPSNYKLSKIVHLASVSESREFLNLNKTSTVMIDFTIDIINLSKNLDIELIFSSSMAVEYLGGEKDIYGVYKKFAEYYIKSNLPKWKILRIPRIYGKDRKKGLMRTLREGTFKGNLSDEVEYVDIDVFINFFTDYINNGRLNVIEYVPERLKEKDTVLNIGKKYECLHIDYNNTNS